MFFHSKSCGKVELYIKMSVKADILRIVRRCFADNIKGEKKSVYSRKAVKVINDISTSERYVCI
jgi:hypothetical protein